MNKIDYFKNAIKNKHYEKLQWFFSMFAIHDIGYEDKYIKVTKLGFVLKMDEEVLMEGDVKKPFMSIDDRIKLVPGDIKNLKRPVITDIGNTLANLCRLVIPFGSKIPFISSKVWHTGDIESILPNLMKNGTISIEEYLEFVSSVSYTLSLTELFVQSSTKKTITPPPNFKKVKDELAKKFDEEYGAKWREDSVMVIRFKDKLSAIDKDYLKDDPGYGKILAGKVVNNSRPRLYSVFGVEYGFDKTGENYTAILESLADGYPKEAKKLAALFNSARSGSFFRGFETQQGGSMAKDSLRPTASLKIVSDDCGTKDGIEIYVSKTAHSILNGSYLIEKDGSIKTITDSSKYIGQTIKVRSPQYCLEEGDGFCKHCMNENLKDLEDGIPLLIITAAGIVLNAKMKSMHTATQELINYIITEEIR